MLLVRMSLVGIGFAAWHRYRKGLAMTGLSQRPRRRRSVNFCRVNIHHPGEDLLTRNSGTYLDRLLLSVPTRNIVRVMPLAFQNLIVLE